MKKKINTSLREERLNADLTQMQLASELSIPRDTIQTIEGGNSIPNVLLAMKIAKYFGKKVEDMFWE